MSSHREKGAKNPVSAAFAVLRSALIVAVAVAALPASAQAISATHLTEGGSGTQAASYDTASISPGANRLVLAWVVNAKNGGASVPSLSGNGLTWVQVNTVAWNIDHRLTLFRAMGAAPTPGPVTISFGPAQKVAAWTIDEFDGVDTSGADGSGAIVQNLAGFDDLAGPAGLTLTLPLPIGSGNATAGGFANADNVLSLFSGAGYTGFPQALVVNPPIGLMSEWRPNGTTTVNATQSGSFPMAGSAVEIKPPTLPLVKQLWVENGLSPISSPATAATGATLVFLIYVKNTGAAQAADVRINDYLDQAGFDYVTGSLVRTSAASPPADTVTDKQIFDATAPGTGTVLSDPVDGDAGSALDTGAPAGVDRITIGAVTGQANAVLNIAANTTFAFRFQVKVK